MPAPKITISRVAPKTELSLIALYEGLSRGSNRLAPQKFQHLATLLAAMMVRSLSPCLRGEGWGEGQFAKAQRSESPPHPARFARPPPPPGGERWTRAPRRAGA